jgi:hypothetical protein
MNIRVRSSHVVEMIKIRENAGERNKPVKQLFGCYFSVEYFFGLILFD